MDKFVLNTEIVSMRHDVRKARVHTINKLVRTSRKLRNKHGSDKEKEKYERKAARFMEEVTIIKSLKDDEISKFALTNKKAPDDILNDVKVPLRERALARLSGHPNIITRVHQFRTKFPSWEDTLVKLLEQLGAKKKKKNSKTKPEQKTASVKVKIENVDDNSVDTSDHEEKRNIPSSDSDIDTSKATKSKIIKTKTKRKKSELSNNNNNASSSKVNVLKKNLAEVKRFSEILKSNDEDNGDSDSIDDIANTDGIDDNKKTVNELPEDKTVDPFFMCEDGETEYVTSIKRIINESGHSEKKQKTVDLFSWKSDDHSAVRQRERKQHGQVLEPKNFNVKGYRHDDYKFGNKNTKSHVQKAVRTEDRKEIGNGDNESIHPSWQAKKRLKEQQHALTAFQGKKIKFED